MLQVHLMSSSDDVSAVDLLVQVSGCWNCCEVVSSIPMFDLSACDKLKRMLKGHLIIRLNIICSMKGAKKNKMEYNSRLPQSSMLNQKSPGHLVCDMQGKHHRIALFSLVDDLQGFQWCMDTVCTEENSCQPVNYRTFCTSIRDFVLPDASKYPKRWLFVHLGFFFRNVSFVLGL
jgi:hypothetical protein